jgi:hypothetical protein
MAALGGMRQATKVEQDMDGKVLGIPLELVTFVDEYGLPLFLTALLKYIELTGMQHAAIGID